MSISADTKTALLAATKEAAAALVEDTAHMTDVLSQDNIPRGEIRRLSAIMRRLLVDNGGDVLIPIDVAHDNEMMSPAVTE